MRLNVAWRSIASGVVRSTSSSTPPTTRLTVPSRPGLPAGGLEQVANEERRGGLAVGAGDAHHVELGRRIAVEACRSRPHRRPHVVHHDLRHAEVEPPLGHERGGTALDRIRSEIVAVRRGSRARKKRAPPG